MLEVLNATATRGTIMLTKSMDMASSNGPVATFIKENIKTMNEMGTAKCTGLMEVATRVNGSGEFNMATVK